MRSRTWPPEVYSGTRVGERRQEAVASCGTDVAAAVAHNPPCTRSFGKTTWTHRAGRQIRHTHARTFTCNLYREYFKGKLCSESRSGTINGVDVWFNQNVREPPHKSPRRLDVITFQRRWPRRRRRWETTVLLCRPEDESRARLRERNF